MKQQIIMNSPIGKLKITIKENKLTGIEVRTTRKNLSQSTDSQHKIITKQIQKEINNYFKDPKAKFTIVLDYAGTEFQKKVWQALQRIPLGKTKTYGELAAELKTSARAIGNACRQNPIPIIIPCHRVVAKSNLGGYSGKTQGKMLDIKTWLLQHEGVDFTQNFRRGSENRVSR